MATASSRNRCSNSPSGRLFSGAGHSGYGRCPSPSSVRSAFASYSASAFSAPVATSVSSPASTDFLRHRAASPTRINLIGSRSVDPIAARRSPISPAAAPRRKTCMCSPTTHPGSFRCKLHKGVTASPRPAGGSHAVSSLNARRSAMANSLVRIGTVEGEWVKRALTALIRPSSHQQRRRATFQRRPSRLSIMSMADNL